MVPISPDSEKKGSSGTYVAQDSEKELTRLKIQDHMVTVGMGGVLPEQPDSALFRRVLDIGCATGGWIIEAAQAYPEMCLIGIDISQRMVEYARAQAEAHQVTGQVQFHVMDAWQALEFATAFFDLVNLRFGVTFLRTWDWPKILRQMHRYNGGGKLDRSRR